MTRLQASKLYNLVDGDKVFVLYRSSPYIADVESGWIDFEDDKYTYNDSTLWGIDVEEADVSDFTVYRKTEQWWRGNKIGR